MRCYDKYKDIQKTVISENLKEKYLDKQRDLTGFVREGIDRDCKLYISCVVVRQTLNEEDEYSFRHPCSQLFYNVYITPEGYMIICCQDFENLTVGRRMKKISYYLILTLFLINNGSVKLTYSTIIKLF